VQCILRASLAATLAGSGINGAQAIRVSGIEPGIWLKSNPWVVSRRESFKNDLEAKLGPVPNSTAENIIVFAPSPQITLRWDGGVLQLLSADRDGWAVPDDLRPNQGVAVQLRARKRKI
jgi:hypothetical protein